MPKSRKRVTALFPGRNPFKKAAKQSRGSNSTDSVLSEDVEVLPNVIAEEGNAIIEEEEDVDEQEQKELQDQSHKEDEALSQLLTGASSRNLQRISSSRASGKPKKSILKSVSSISESSHGAGSYFTASNHSKESKLSFSSISVRVYPVLIGDNPSVTEGVPLTIGWEPSAEESFAVEEYESSHKAEPVSSLQEMKFTEQQRAQIAKNLGYSDNKISKIAHQVKFSTLTRKKKIIRTLHLDKMKASYKRGLTKASDSTRKIFGTNNQDEEEEDSGDDRDMAF